MEEALIALALADAGLAALFGTRINWLKRPQGSALPALVLQVVSVPWTYTTKGRCGLVGRLVQFDVYAGDYRTMKAGARALRSFLDTVTADPFSGAFIENERETQEPQDGADATGSTNFFRTSADVRVWSLDA